ncbi:MAG: hypothetical protein KF748_03905 [Xanthobacteraceae bacterium]|nr:hypothetical protein [Xanthobacteraceae bacterium]
MPKTPEEPGNPSAEESAAPVLSAAEHTHLGKCECGAARFVLVNELTVNERDEPDAGGIRVSRMYECAACGEYRLG